MRCCSHTSGKLLHVILQILHSFWVWWALASCAETHMLSPESIPRRLQEYSMSQHCKNVPKGLSYSSLVMGQEKQLFSSFLFCFLWCSTLRRRLHSLLFWTERILCIAHGLVMIQTCQFCGRNTYLWSCKHIVGQNGTIRLIPKLPWSCFWKVIALLKCSWHKINGRCLICHSIGFEYVMKS